MLDNILSFVVAAVATIIIIALVIFLVKDVIGYLKGQGTSLFAILGKIGAVILIVALIFLAKNFSSTGESLSEGVGGVIDQGIEEINEGIGGGAD